MAVSALAWPLPEGASSVKRIGRNRIDGDKFCGRMRLAELQRYRYKTSYKLWPSKSHLTTRIVTSSWKPTSAQKLAAPARILATSSSADNEKSRCTMAERRSTPNSSSEAFSASVTPSV